ncbi:hypothetical protein MJO28_016502 [Puccinia striiformis f. sp. tritici]|uniref:Uncharacterized protein n=1 Tax=Puccinia striiformis f. sp. tritici TaxID=168172 RepID=A0ACC0DP57_9BASI|nr:hypothetical protein MJO28_016502 [Puccinia striiformis f. sp. tritici]
MIMKKAKYDPIDKATPIREANKYHKILINKNLPSMKHMEYKSTYHPLDFSSFLSFTMYDFYNTPHMDHADNT